MFFSSVQSTLSKALVLAVLLLPGAALAEGWGFDGTDGEQRTPIDTVDFLSDAFTSPALGDPEAPVTLVVYSRFDCVSCASYLSTVQEQLGPYLPEVRIIYHPILRSLGSQDEDHARAGMAAHFQGKFWEFHAAVLEALAKAGAQTPTSIDLAFEDVAVRLGLDLVAFAADRESDEMTAWIEEEWSWNQILGASDGLIYVNGRPFDTSEQFFSTELQAIVLEELLKARTLQETPALSSPLVASPRLTYALTQANTDALDGHHEFRYHDTLASTTSHMVYVEDDDIAVESNIEGGEDSLLTLVALVRYSDLGIDELQTSVEEISYLYGKAMRVVYKMSTRPLIHSDTRMAEIAIAANTLGSFDQTHACLVALGATGEVASCTSMDGCESSADFDKRLRTALDDCGLDTDALFAAAADASIRETLARMRSDATNYGLRGGGQALFINGARFVGAQDDLRGIIEASDTHLDSIRLALMEGMEVSEAYEWSMLNALTSDALRVHMPLEGLPSKGRDDALVTVVEFSDFQCPYCAQLGQTFEELQVIYGDDLRVVYAHFPLAMHAEALPAARAAWAAQQQGRFWEFHDVLVDNTKTLSDALYTQTAADLGLDLEMWERDRTSATATAAIDRQILMGSLARVKGTPCSFVNGLYVSGALPLESFVQMIDRELALAAALIDSDARWTPDEYYREISLLHGLDADPEVTSTPVNLVPPQEIADRVYVDRVAHPTQGAYDALVTVVEFSDFQCPYCAKVQASLEQITNTYGDKVRRVFVNLPLNFHVDAEPAARAAMAAYLQDPDAFWPFSQALFESDSLGESDFIEIATSQGLDLDVWKIDYASMVLSSRVADDVALAQSLGISGTPNFLVNGIPMTGAQPYEAFARVIDAELALAQLAIDEGSVEARDYYDHITGHLFAKVEAQGAPEWGNSKDATHQIALFVDLDNSHGLDNLLWMQQAIGTLDASEFHILLMPIIREGSEQSEWGARAIFAADDFEEALELAIQIMAAEIRDEEGIIAAATSAGVDAVEDTFDSGKIKKKLKKIADQAQAFDVLGSPSFVMDGRVWRGSPPP